MAKRDCRACGSEADACIYCRSCVDRIMAPTRIPFLGGQRKQGVPARSTNQAKTPEAQPGSLSSYPSKASEKPAKDTPPALPLSCTIIIVIVHGKIWANPLK